MAKAQYHKNQRVFVKTVGTWSIVERVLPQWAKGLDEPIRIYYDVGLGRDFGADELQAEQTVNTQFDDGVSNWRIIRARNKWQSPEDSSHHPHPGTYPVVVTGETDWGGWRVPGAEYDLSPQKIEAQARLITYGPKLYSFATALLEAAKNEAEHLPDSILELARDVAKIVKSIDGQLEPAS
ncbi:MAG: hypothetical protein U1F24_16010 [Alphaproteobacteria bacterium]|jgi:hypothetical protein